MGSKEEDVPVEPTEKPSFIEDMTEAERNTALELPVGIKNLGNTCYLNAVVQCLKTVPELHSAIIDFKPKRPGAEGESSGTPSSMLTLEVDSGSLLTLAIQDCYRTMDSGKTAVPVVLVNLFRSTFPRFAEQGEQGMYMQQDASECWTELMRLLMQEVPAKDASKTAKSFAFFYKEKEAVNAKILKDVKFPMVLDVFDLCTPELQKKLSPIRGKYKANYGSNNSGFYQLQAVLTHQGRSSSSGHYVGWVRWRGNEWLKCDDDDVTPVLEEDILKLSGGGECWGVELSE
ncbi:Ubiquitin carboxyl-terminal hydrolase 14 [Portunus trituberculatus]|uniref:ubiquitinyl hydrolase 1 n=1 Tax=Portunus trituberculatus TaxID=210409 RepID=A0A5B7EAY3_PORTR|nr:Ubiquitin carboxyl-terminal hydrolase 14 [Portunus trituberculatus]